MIKFSFLAGAGLAAIISITIPTVAPASESLQMSSITQSGFVDEISSAKKRRVIFTGPSYVDAMTGEVINPLRPLHLAPSHDFIGGPDGYPGEYAVRRAAGQCVMDFGYGRWQAC